jgi:hypothetical protein
MARFTSCSINGAVLQSAPIGGTVASNPADTYMAPSHGWTCFHCGETFHVEAQARGHFGPTPEAEPACLIRAGAVARVPRSDWPDIYLLRELEAEIERLRNNAASDFSETYYARLGVDIRQTGPAFKDCRTLRDVFNLYDSMEGRALAAEERLKHAYREDGRT